MTRPAAAPMSTRPVSSIQLLSKAYFTKNPMPRTSAAVPM